MRTIFLFTLWLFYSLFSLPVAASAGTESENNDSCIISAVYMTENSSLLEITSSGRTVEDAIEQGQRKAVEVCLFPKKDLSLKLKPICLADTRDKHKAYFDYFLESVFLDFVRLTPDGFPQQKNRRKTENGYEVSIKVEVLYQNLYTEMLNEGIID